MAQPWRRPKALVATRSAGDLEALIIRLQSSYHLGHADFALAGVIYTMFH